MKKYLSSRRGFTLIELMVVIAIIGILSAVVIVNISSSRSKARDAKRISDIAQIQLALEQYFDRCREYPPADGGSIASESACDFTEYISVIPKDPLTKANYTYGVDDDEKPLDYILRAELENTGNGATAEGLTADVGSEIHGIQPCAPLTKYYCVGPK